MAVDLPSFACAPGCRVVLQPGPRHDPAAERVVLGWLRERGAVVVDGGAQLVVRVGEVHDGPPESYGLVVEPGLVRLAGADAAGVHHAAQALRALARPQEPLPAVRTSAAPAMPFRGSIEGFYGTPWSHEDRLAHLDHLAALRMNTYVYAPKDDAHHRERWREPYPPGELARLGELVERARERHVRFVFTVSPGLSMRYSDEADVAALLAKFQAVHDLGGRDFAVAMDDIDPRVWHADADAERFAEGAGAAHAWLTGRVVEWARGLGDCAPVQFVPTEYYDLADTPYKRALRERLDPQVLVWWTGDGVVPATITRADAAAAADVYGHRLLVWDNFPVNDYLPGRIPLGDWSGRQDGLSAHVEGVLANPMVQPTLSRVALHSFAEYGWDDQGFDPRASWRRALAAQAGGRADVLDALVAFADLNTRDERLHLAQAPRHAAGLDAVRAAWRTGDVAAAQARLRRIAARLAAVPETVRRGVDPRFAAEAAPWLDATGLLGRALAAVVPVLAGDTRTQVRAEIGELLGRVAALRDHTLPHRGGPVLVGDGVIDRFLLELVEHTSGGGASIAPAPGAAPPG
ncbi:protein O-GlcNAcase [Pseudonocardia sp. MH-G8]|uniref:protein O-GlcNAcase n=1 Tax=Pseudonocardia sp. MH-G8 TaxID=1854588 RepID=UPI000BA010EC|nr:protein O-GlcNAcase [Pseudonocardia sp. MH-G8]OZM75635.1 beta-N-acetylhexosaminidase [Pseudonocardia sp. MH-G8]